MRLNHHHHQKFLLINIDYKSARVTCDKHLGWLEIILEMGCKTRIKLYTLKAIITPRRRNVAAQVAGDLKRSHTLPSYGGTQKERKKKEKAIIMDLYHFYYLCCVNTIHIFISVTTETCHIYDQDNEMTMLL